jgi:hypothetical protein
MTINSTGFIDFIKIIKKDPNFTLTTTDLGYYEEYMALYASQIKKFDLFYFETYKSNREYDILTCQLQYLATPIWQEKNLKVSKLDIKSNTLTPLILNQDYRCDYLYIEDKKYIRGLNFNCLSCNCECEKIVINGIYGFDFDENLIRFIYLAMYQAIGTVPTNTSCKDNIKSETTGNYSVTYYDKTNTTVKTNTAFNPLMIYSYPQIWEIIQYYKQFFIVI